MFSNNSQQADFFFHDIIFLLTYYDCKQQDLCSSATVCEI